MIRTFAGAMAIMALSGCAATSNTAAENTEASKDKVYFVIGNNNALYDLTLSKGTIDNYVFIEDMVSTVKYQSTVDNDYIIGEAYPGDVIGISTTSVMDASGQNQGDFIPCNKTLVFKIPENIPSIYVAHIQYDWGTVSIKPLFSTNLLQANTDLTARYINEVEGMIQTTYRFLHTQLVNDCENYYSDPLEMSRAK
ncbi:hypothetical protein [Photobacterium nomapromontoriensis]|uniref:hypothetical protein n=1 Tax=Photobacterium nomapromontoriensis TaxID=2910237 RepID=UPI003D0C7B05